MSEDSFAALFEAHAKQHTFPTTVRVGDRIEGVIVEITPHTIFVELDGKRQAMIDTLEFRDRDGNVTMNVGDTVRAKVLTVDDDTGEVRLGNSLGKILDLTSLQQAHAAGAAVEGKVTGFNKGGLEVEVAAGLRGFCPLSQVGRHGGAEAAEYVGQTLTFLVLEIKDGGRNLVLSRRRLLENEARDARESALQSLSKGATVQGTVTAVREFGAFVDLGGIEGLLPASEIAAERGIVVADHVQAGETVTVQILDIKTGEKGETRITLSRKALESAPSSAARPAASAAVRSLGSVVEGDVVRVESYGVFVQVRGTSGREGRGLIPAAELGVPRGADLRKAFPLGQVLTAKILETGEGRLKLSVRGAKDDAERSEYVAHQEKAAGPATFGTFGDLLSKRAKKSLLNLAEDRCQQDATEHQHQHGDEQQHRVPPAPTAVKSARQIGRRE